MVSIVLLSVIVPIYLKPPQFLRACIESILDQSLSEFELILVNDASPDDTLHIMEHYAARDRRIKIVNLKRNCGVAAARNVGLAMAQGKYILFIDADDIVMADYFKILVGMAQRFSLDIVVSGVTNFRTIDQLKPVPFFDWTKVQYQKAIPLRTAMVQHFICRLFLRSTIRNLRFDEKLDWGEDILFIHQAMLVAKRSAEINYKGYAYRHPPREVLETYKQQFYAATSEHYPLKRRIEVALYLVKRLCMLENYQQNASDEQFIHYFSLRRFLRYANWIWKLTVREEKITYWGRFREVFEEYIYPHQRHRFLGPFLCLLFKPVKPHFRVRMYVYITRMLCEIYYLRQNKMRCLRVLKLLFKGVAWF
ncbi:MAG: glycosyltransferase [Puniceicoccales bacterium]|jgi:glycosyltransferase involved in cell wall biosynthesis|nr:glycosyltransferase [Puniceicoccales bacterium]